MSSGLDISKLSVGVGSVLRMTETSRGTSIRPLLIALIALVAAALALVAPPAARAHDTDAEPVQLGAGFRPEGVESGPGDTYYAGSLADGRIATGDLSEGTTRVLLPGVPGRALRGLFRDPRSGLLWAAGQDGTTGIVLAVDSRSGEVEARVVVPGAVFLNDLVVTRGAVWVTDSRVDRLTRIPLDRRGAPAGDVSFLPLGAPWPAYVSGVNANGIRALPDGTLVLNNSTAGGLWTVDPRSGAVRPLPVSGGPGLTGGDGLELRGRTLYDVRGSGQAEVSVVKLDRTKEGWTGRWAGALTDPALDVPSTATVAGGRLWAVNARFGVADPATATYAIVPLPLKPKG